MYSLAKLDHLVGGIAIYTYLKPINNSREESLEVHPLQGNPDNRKPKE